MPHTIHMTQSPPAATAIGRVREKLRELFSVDLRSLALLRVGLGISIVLDLAHRALDLRLLYTDDGVLPRVLLLEMQGRGAMLSIHYWGSAEQWQQALIFTTNAACAVALMVGWRTWIATLACWYFACSLQIRQPLVYMGGDSILRLLLFWSLFLPLNARFSLDAARGRVALPANRLLSGGSVALLLQVCLMYWATGISKSGELWQTGQAVFYALHWNMATPLGVWLRGAPSSVLEMLTYGTLAVELFGPLLAFVPIFTPAFRLLTIALFWGFHAGLAAAINIGLFPLFSAVAWLAFIPSQAWERIRSPAMRDYVPIRGAYARATSWLAILAIAYVVIFLAERWRFVPRVLPQAIHTVGWGLRLQQSWDMFAPDPPTRSHTLFVREIGSGGVVRTLPAADGIRPELYAGYLLALPPRERTSSSHRFARYWCNEGSNETGSTVIEAVALIVESRDIYADGTDPPTTQVLASVPCGN
jgi:hypothetical protein